MARGKNIVLLHGWGATVTKLIPLKKELEKKGWQVLLPKLPGFDLAAPKIAWGLSEYVEFVHNKAEKGFGGSGYYLFGHSFGGRITLKSAIEGNNKLAGIVLCSASGISRGNHVKRAVFIIFAKTGKALMFLPFIARFWRKIIYKLAGEHDYEKTRGVMKDVFKKIITENLKNKIDSINTPALILWGKQDKMTPVKDSFFLKNNLKQSKLVVFESDGHRLPYNKPKKLSLEIDKWAKNLK